MSDFKLRCLTVASCTLCIGVSAKRSWVIDITSSCVHVARLEMRFGGTIDGACNDGDKRVPRLVVAVQVFLISVRCVCQV